MKITGSHVVSASPRQVWDALQDPQVLVATIPGCLELTEVGEDTWTARVEAGIASIRGVYDGQVSLHDQRPPDAYTLHATGSGGPGTIDATARVTLTADDGCTRVDYDADAMIGGPIAGVGQRVVAGVAKRNAASFFAAVDEHLTAEDRSATTSADMPEAPAGARGDDTGDAGAHPGDGSITYHPGERATRPSEDPMRLLAAAVVGAAIALLGVVVGRRTGR